MMTTVTPNERRNAARQFLRAAEDLLARLNEAATQYEVVEKAAAGKIRG